MIHATERDGRRIVLKRIPSQLIEAVLCGMKDIEIDGISLDLIDHEDILLDANLNMRSRKDQLRVAREILKKAKLGIYDKSEEDSYGDEPNNSLLGLLIRSKNKAKSKTFQEGR